MHAVGYVTHHEASQKKYAVELESGAEVEYFHESETEVLAETEAVAAADEEAGTEAVVVAEVEFEGGSEIETKTEAEAIKGFEVETGPVPAVETAPEVEIETMEMESEEEGGELREVTFGVFDKTFDVAEIFSVGRELTAVSQVAAAAMGAAAAEGQVEEEEMTLEAEAEGEVEAEVEVEAGVEGELVPEEEVEVEAELKAEVVHEAVAEAAFVAEAEAEVEVEAEVKADVVLEAEAAFVAGAEAESEVEAEVVVEAGVEAESAAGLAVEAEVEVELVPEQVVEFVFEVRAEVVPEGDGVTEPDVEGESDSEALTEVEADTPAVDLKLLDVVPSAGYTSTSFDILPIKSLEITLDSSVDVDRSECVTDLARSATWGAEVCSHPASELQASVPTISATVLPVASQDVPLSISSSFLEGSSVIPVCDISLQGTSIGITSSTDQPLEEVCIESDESQPTFLSLGRSGLSLSDRFSVESLGENISRASVILPITESLKMSSHESLVLEEALPMESMDTPTFVSLSEELRSPLRTEYSGAASRRKAVSASEETAAVAAAHDGLHLGLTGFKRPAIDPLRQIEQPPELKSAVIEIPIMKKTEDKKETTSCLNRPEKPALLCFEETELVTVSSTVSLEEQLQEARNIALSNIPDVKLFEAEEIPIISKELQGIPSLSEPERFVLTSEIGKQTLSSETAEYLPLSSHESNLTDDVTYAEVDEIELPRGSVSKEQIKCSSPVLLTGETVGSLTSSGFGILDESVVLVASDECRALLPEELRTLDRSEELPMSSETCLASRGRRSDEDLRQLAAATGTNLLTEFSEVDEEEEEYVPDGMHENTAEESVQEAELFANRENRHLGRVRSYDLSANQVLSSALDRSMKMLNRLQSYGFRSGFAAQPANTYLPEISPVTSHVQSSAADDSSEDEKIPFKTKWSKVPESYQTIEPPVSAGDADFSSEDEGDNESGTDEVIDYVIDSLEDLVTQRPTEMDKEQTVEDEVIDLSCSRDGLSPIMEAVGIDQNSSPDLSHDSNSSLQLLNLDTEIDIGESSSKEQLDLIKETEGEEGEEESKIGTDESDILPMVGRQSDQSDDYNLRLTRDESHSFEPCLSTVTWRSTTPEESSRESQSTIVQVLHASQVITQRPKTAEERRAMLPSETYSSDGTDLLVVRRYSSGELAPDGQHISPVMQGGQGSHTTLASIESDLNLVDRKQSFFDLPDASASSGTCDAGLTRSEISGAVSMPKLSSKGTESTQLLEQQSAVKEEKYEDGGIPYGRGSLQELKKGTTDMGGLRTKYGTADDYPRQGNGSGTSSSLSEFERLEREVAAHSTSTSMSSVPRESAPELSSQTSSLSEFLRNERECEGSVETIPPISDELQPGPHLSSLLELSLSRSADLAPEPSSLAQSGLITTIYEDVLAEQQASVMTQSTDSATAPSQSGSLTAGQDVARIYHMLQDEIDQTRTASMQFISMSGVEDERQPRKPLAETAGEGIGYEEGEELIDLADADSLAHSSMYDSLIPSVNDDAYLVERQQLQNEWASSLIQEARDELRRQQARESDSLESSDHFAVAGTSDSLCTTSSSVDSSFGFLGTTEDIVITESGVVEFVPHQLQLLHQQYCEGLEFSPRGPTSLQPCEDRRSRRDSVDSLELSYERRGAISEEETESSMAIAQGPSYSQAGPTQSTKSELMSDSLEDSGAIFGLPSEGAHDTEHPQYRHPIEPVGRILIADTVGKSALGDHGGDQQTHPLECCSSAFGSGPAVEITEQPVLGNIVAPTELLTPLTRVAGSTTSLNIISQTADELGLISHTDSNLESAIFDASEDDVAIYRDLSEHQNLQFRLTDSDSQENIQSCFSTSVTSAISFEDLGSAMVGSCAPSGDNSDLVIFGGQTPTEVGDLIYPTTTSKSDDPNERKLTPITPIPTTAEANEPGNYCDSTCAKTEPISRP
ncbi:hypothetical protein FBUS_01053 [Fasciolopsis buskii]|uniref:Uncharacterized protein n=1 Tax=Fasciolopsis buskii TaxID=27845 RepID=A0A8E0VFP1_9TREM|nr:hypothetical protein FBUS_01053 [Fasciolopsis buski]